MVVVVVVVVVVVYQARGDKIEGITDKVRGVVKEICSKCIE